MGQLNPSRDLTWPMTRLTHLKITHFNLWPDWPDPPILPHLGFSALSPLIIKTWSVV